MERSGPDDARDDAWDDAWSGASDDDATPPPGRWTGRGRGPDPSGRPDERDADPDPLSGLEPFRGFGRFEGFDPFDAFDPSDLSDGMGAPDGANGSPGDPIEWYPPAPLPAHERTWRHPSELGLAAWQQSEPPVSIGRGLLVTTGAIGSVLGVAVLYLMLPASGASPISSPTATASTALLRPPAISLADLPAVTAFRSEAADTLDVVSSAPWFDEPGLTLPATDTPSTVLVMAAAGGPADVPMSVAIAIEGAPYVVTTATAIGLAEDVHLMGASSDGDASAAVPMDASVVSIHGDLAFLEPTSALEVVSFAATAPVAPGQPVTVLGDEPIAAVYIETSVPELDSRVIVEGTPVVDGDGALVALCTVVIDAEGAHVDFVPVHESTNDANPVTDPATQGTTTDGTAAPGTGGPADSTTVPSATPPAGATTSVPAGEVPAPGITTAPTRPPGTTPASPATTPTTTAAPSSTSVPTAWVGLRFDGAPTTSPLTITGVVAGSPAMAAGVMVGERLVAIDGREVRTVTDVVDAIRSRAPGDVVRFTLAARVIGATSPSTSVAAGGATTTTTTTIAAVPANSAGTATPVPTTTSSGASSGTRYVSLVLVSFAPTV